jgi:kinetochore protein Mis13/DSN1
VTDYGVILAEPHPSIAHEEYYKHIHDELLEPQRMKQLLAWCGRKALTPKDGKVGDANAAAVGRFFFLEICGDDGDQIGPEEQGGN